MDTFLLISDRKHMVIRHYSPDRFDLLCCLSTSYELLEIYLCGSTRRIYCM